MKLLLVLLSKLLLIGLLVTEMICRLLLQIGLFSIIIIIITSLLKPPALPLHQTHSDSNATGVGLYPLGCHWRSSIGEVVYKVTPLLRNLLRSSRISIIFVENETICSRSDPVCLTTGIDP